MDRLPLRLALCFDLGSIDEFAASTSTASVSPSAPHLLFFTQHHRFCSPAVAVTSSGEALVPLRVPAPRSVGCGAEADLTLIVDMIGGSERILRTPIPLSYTQGPNPCSPGPQSAATTDAW